MMVDVVAAELDRVHERIAGLERKNGWTLAEWARKVSRAQAEKRG
jgi:hypothetical protein